MLGRINLKSMIRFGVFLTAMLCGLAVAWILFSAPPKRLQAIRLNAPSKKIQNTATLTSQNFKELIQTVESDELIFSKAEDKVVAEVKKMPGTDVVSDLKRLGYGSSSFLMDHRWATVRFLGPSPAGAGLRGRALNEAQMKAFATPQDTIPVVTASLTIFEMMEDYFSPLLLSLQDKFKILDRLKVQAVYYSPEYKPSDESELERSNAYVVGLQSMYFFPTGCFNNNSLPSCKEPYLSVAHDPTMIGHELSHVIYNFLRYKNEKEALENQASPALLELAINEAMADYFVASYFSEPVLGRIWNHDQGGKAYVRSLLDLPDASDATLKQEAHRLAGLWSSSLWRIRSRWIQELGRKSFDFDRVLLNSISFLGATGKRSFEDALAALKSSLKELGFESIEVEAILKEEAAKVQISSSLQPAPRLEANADESQAAISKEDYFSEAKNPKPSCGVVSALPGESQAIKLHCFLLFLLVPVLVLIRRLAKGSDAG